MVINGQENLGRKKRLGRFEGQVTVA